MYKVDYEILVPTILFLQSQVCHVYAILIYYFCRVFLLHLHLSREFVNKVKNIILSPVVGNPIKYPVTLVCKTSTLK